MIKLRVHKVSSLLSIFLLSLLIHPVFAQERQEQLPLKQFMLNGKIYQIEIAQTPKQLSIGLMGRKTLENQKGMLFDFGYLSQHGIWMKNMSIPLTITWLNDNYKVIDLKKVQPCEQHPCIIYRSKDFAKYVLELNINDTIKIGDQLSEIMPK